MSQTPDFQYDVFLSHSSKDKDVVRDIAERLRTDGVHVWFDEEAIRPGDCIPAKIEEGLEHSRILVLCMSANAFASDWAQLESYTFRFRDPMNKERRVIPLRLDEADIKGSLAYFYYISWLPSDREHGYAKLIEACRMLITEPPSVDHDNSGKAIEEEDHLVCAFSPDGKRVLTGGGDNAERISDRASQCCLHNLENKKLGVSDVAMSAVASTLDTVMPGAHPLLTRIHVTPETGTINTIFSFFPTAMEDDSRIPSGEMRWDWNGDGVFDTPFIDFVADPAPGSGDSPPTLTHQFTTPGVHHVCVQVRSHDGSVGSATVEVSVQ